MPALLPVGGGHFAISLSENAPKALARISYDYFFDRDLIINTLDAAVRKALYKSGSVVFQIARRSIKRQGMARPKLQIMKENPDLTVRELISRTAGGVDRKNNRLLIKRLSEIRRKDPSAPGTPPHTHRGNLRDKPGIVYAYDTTSESVVIGQSEPTIAWMAALHEFGGTEQMQGWAWIPRYPRYTHGIIGWWRVGLHPRKLGSWEPTRFREVHRYPARPYMRPAIAKAIASREIVQQFANSFRVGGL